MTRHITFYGKCVECIRQARLRDWHFEIVPVSGSNSAIGAGYYAAIRKADSAHDWRFEIVPVSGSNSAIGAGYYAAIRKADSAHSSIESGWSTTIDGAVNLLYEIVCPPDAVVPPV